MKYAFAIILLLAGCQEAPTHKIDHDAPLEFARIKESTAIRTGGSRVIYAAAGDKFPIISTTDGAVIILLQEFFAYDTLMPFLSRKQQDGMVLDSSGCSTGKYAAIGRNSIGEHEFAGMKVDAGICFELP